MDWITHEEDVWFDFRGDKPQQLEPGRYYRGTVDGYADFGVFVDLAPGVTGLLHRSELDRRLESLDWEPGDTVFVQVKNVRDNGNIDLAWSKRQRPEEFRGARIHDPSGEHDGEPIEDDGEQAESSTVVHTPTQRSDGERGQDESEPEADAAAESDQSSASTAEAEEDSTTRSESDADESKGDEADADESEADESDADESDADESDADVETAGAGAGSGGSVAAAVEADQRADVESTVEAESAETSAEVERSESEAVESLERIAVEQLGDRVGETVRIEGEIVSARQTGGPTVFELRDETGVIDCAAFVEAGVRAYPEIEEGDVVRLEGEVEMRRDELQVETEALVELEGDEAAAVERRLADALTDKARPESVEPLGDHAAVAAVTEQLADAAEEIRRAVLESRPVIVRHAATADGYIAGAAIERAILPLIREEHAKADAEYHFFDRRPLESAVYDMDDATRDVTRMLQDRDRHGEKLPLVLLVGTGSTEASVDGLGLLDVYGAPRVVVDAAPADEAVREAVETLVNPALAGADAGDLSNGALASTLATAVRADVREDVRHLPAASYWEAPPEVYVDLASEAGYDAETLAELREAVALEAHYQSYEPKRELVTDLLFGGGAAEEGLAAHVSEQFRAKLEDELGTARANLQSHETGGVRFAVLDADAYTHRFDFPPTTLLLDELHRQERDEGPFATVALGTDELYVRTTPTVDVREVADIAREFADDAGITALGVREGRIEFLSGRRDAVEDAVVAAIAELLG
jgi:RecJ-like exonuclease